MCRSLIFLMIADAYHSAILNRSQNLFRSCQMLYKVLNENISTQRCWDERIIASSARGADATAFSAISAVMLC